MFASVRKKPMPITVLSLFSLKRSSFLENNLRTKHFFFNKRYNLIGISTAFKCLLQCDRLSLLTFSHCLSFKDQTLILRKFISQLTNVILVFAAFERVILATTKHERSLFLQNNAPVSSECGLYPDGSGFMSMINIIYRLH